MKYIANIENGKQNPSFDILSSILHVPPLSLDSVINPNLSEAERECRELESIYFACPPEMRKTLLDATRSLAIHLTELSEQNNFLVISLVVDFEPLFQWQDHFLAYHIVLVGYGIRLRRS